VRDFRATHDFSDFPQDKHLLFRSRICRCHPGSDPKPQTIMARHKKYEALESDQPLLDISSLIDVCFLLLIYFLVTSTIAPRERDLDLKLPTYSVTADPQPVIDPMHIHITASGGIFTGLDAGKQLMDEDTSIRDLPLLSGALNLYASAGKAAGSRPLVQVHADDGASQQRVIDVLNALAGAGISAVTFTELTGSLP
jgi:biopolymer transport protein ExbD